MTIVQPVSSFVISTERCSSAAPADERETVFPLREDTETELLDETLPGPLECECAEVELFRMSDASSDEIQLSSTRPSS